MIVERRKSEGNNKKSSDLEKPNSAKQSTITKTHHTKSEDLGELIPLFDWIFCVSNAKLVISKLLSNSLQKRGNEGMVYKYDIECNYFTSYLISHKINSKASSYDQLLLEDSFDLNFTNDSKPERQLDITENSGQILNAIKGVSNFKFKPIDFETLKSKFTKSSISSK